MRCCYVHKWWVNKCVKFRAKIRSHCWKKCKKILFTPHPVEKVAISDEASRSWLSSRALEAVRHPQTKSQHRRTIRGWVILISLFPMGTPSAILVRWFHRVTRSSCGEFTLRLWHFHCDDLLLHEKWTRHVWHFLKVIPAVKIWSGSLAFLALLSVCLAWQLSTNTMWPWIDAVNSLWISRLKNSVPWFLHFLTVSLF